jgi:hypothetical protein
LVLAVPAALCLATATAAPAAAADCTAAAYAWIPSPFTRVYAYGAVSCTFQFDGIQGVSQIEEADPNTGVYRPFGTRWSDNWQGIPLASYRSLTQSYRGTVTICRWYHLRTYYVYVHRPGAMIDTYVGGAVSSPVRVC